MKRVLCSVLLIALVVIPGIGLTEGNDTLQLARTIYTLGRDETYETKLMIGSVIMNRVESPWYPDSIQEVIGQPHQFPHGIHYDGESLRAAREVMMGRRTLPEDIVCYVALSSASFEGMDHIHCTSGNYGFYPEH